MSIEKHDSVRKVRFREEILKAENHMLQLIQSGAADDVMPNCILTHVFSPVHDEYGCCTYSRQMFIPKGTVIVGKIHKHQHHNFIMQGKVSVATEFGKKYFTAPCVFISETGLKRAVFAEEDTIWVTVHLTKFHGEENLDKIEAETIAPTYESMGLISSLDKVKRIQK